MEHSNQVREFLITGKGIELRDVYIGEGQVLTGSARLVQETRDKADAMMRKQEIERKKRELEQKRKMLESQTSALRAQSEMDEERLRMDILQAETHEDIILADRMRLLETRKADVITGTPHRKKG